MAAIGVQEGCDGVDSGVECDIVGGCAGVESA